MKQDMSPFYKFIDGLKYAVLAVVFFSAGKLS